MCRTNCCQLGLCGAGMRSALGYLKLHKNVERRGEIGGVTEEGEGSSGVGTRRGWPDSAGPRRVNSPAGTNRTENFFSFRHKRFSPVLVQFSTREGHFGSCDAESQAKPFKIRTLEPQFPYLKRKHWVFHFYQVVMICFNLLSFANMVMKRWLKRIFGHSYKNGWPILFSENAEIESVPDPITLCSWQKIKIQPQIVFALLVTSDLR